MQVTVKHTPTDITEGKRIKACLTQTGQSANSYIKADLDNKGFAIDDGKKY